jgi:hypothetical protein
MSKIPTKIPAIGVKKLTINLLAKFASIKSSMWIG